MFKRLRYYLRFLKSLFQINFRLLWGMWRLTKLPQPTITVFGGSRIDANSIYAQKARQIAKMLVADGFSIITGGGPGIMEAANEGALDFVKECDISDRTHCKPIVSAGIGLLRLNKEEANPYVQENIVMDHFFTRKWLLVRYSIGFVIFPGGFGTLDELFEIVTLMQTDHMQQAPIVLVDSAYWQHIIQWIEEKALAENLIAPKDRNIIQVVDTVEEAFKIIKTFCREQQS